MCTLWISSQLQKQWLKQVDKTFLPKFLDAYAPSVQFNRYYHPEIEAQMGPGEHTLPTVFMQTLIVIALCLLNEH